jgi:hypothetical protein
MASRFSEASLRSERARKMSLIALAALVLVVLLAAAVYATCCIIGFPDMMPPDDGPVRVVVDGHVHTYTVASRSATKLTLKRDGRIWLTITKTGAEYQIIDASISTKTIVHVTAPTR